MPNDTQVQVLAGRGSGSADSAEHGPGSNAVSTSNGGVLHMSVVRGEDFGIAPTAHLVAHKDFALVGVHAGGCKGRNMPRHGHHHAARGGRNNVSRAGDVDVDRRLVDPGIVVVTLGWIGVRVTDAALASAIVDGACVVLARGLRELGNIDGDVVRVMIERLGTTDARMCA